MFFKKKSLLIRYAVKVAEEVTEISGVFEFAWILADYIADAPVEEMEDRARLIGQRAIRQLSVHLSSPDIKCIRPIVLLFYRLSGLKGKQNYFYLNKDFVRGCVNCLQCGVNLNINDMAFAISNWIVEGDYSGELFFCDEILEQFCVLLHEKPNEEILENVTFCFVNFCDSKNERFLQELIFKDDFLGLILGLMNVASAQVRINAMSVMYSLVEFDVEMELGVKMKILNHHNFGLIKEIEASEGDELFVVAKSLIERVYEINN